MASQETSKSAQTKQIGVRVPLALYGEYLAVATARGIDMTALVNEVLTDGLPGLMKWRFEHELELLMARARSGLDDHLRELAATIARLQHAYDEVQRIKTDGKAKDKAA